MSNQATKTTAMTEKVITAQDCDELCGEVRRELGPNADEARLIKSVYWKLRVKVDAPDDRDADVPPYDYEIGIESTLSNHADSKDHVACRKSFKRLLGTKP